MTQYLTSPNSLNSTICKLKSPTLDIRKEMHTLHSKADKQPLSARKYKPFADPIDISRKANDLFDTSKKEHPNRRILSRGHQRTHTQTSPQNGGIISRLNKYIQNEEEEAYEINCANVYNFEKELFGSYNFPHDFDSAIDIISKAKEWTDNPKAYVEENINEGNEDRWQKRSTLPSRRQVILLEKWIKYRQEQIVNGSYTEQQKHQKLTILYFIGFLELTRQDSIICIERGKALTSIWSGYFKLQESIRKHANQESENYSNRLTSLLQSFSSSKDDIVQMKNEKIQTLEISVISLKNELDKVSEHNKTLSESLASKIKDLENLQQYSDQMQQTLAIKDSENKSLRLLGGGYVASDTSKPNAVSNLEKVDCTLDINKLREMMIRKRIAKNAGKKEEEPKQQQVSAQRKQSIFYDDYEEYQNKKKLTIRELLKPKNSMDTIDRPLIDEKVTKSSDKIKDLELSDTHKHFVMKTQTIFNKGLDIGLRNVMRVISSVCAINVI